jgi:hypothetical protein
MIVIHRPKVDNFPTAAVRTPPDDVAPLGDRGRPDQAAVLAALSPELVLDPDVVVAEPDDLEELADESLDELDSFEADSLAAGFEPLPALLSVR